MNVLLLSRPKVLTAAEIKALPKGCVATKGEGGVVARAEIDLPLGGLLGYAVAMGRAVPDALFSVEGLHVVAASTPAPGAAPGASPGAGIGAPAPTALAEGSGADEVITEADPWKLVAAGQLAQAERVFAAGNGLDSAGRERCRALFTDRDPERLALGCRIARVTAWKSIVVTLRPLLTHAHPSVRRDAATAIGALAGPSMAATLRPLLADPDAEVRAAATEGLAKLGG
jgi:hypothetical protein